MSTTVKLENSTSHKPNWVEGIPIYLSGSASNSQNKTLLLEVSGKVTSEGVLIITIMNKGYELSDLKYHSIL